MVLGSREHGAGGMSGKEMQLAPAEIARAAGSGASVPVESCQVCGHAPLAKVLSLGYMPPVNQMVAIGEVPRQQPWFPTDLLHCAKCELVQLGLAVDPVIIFPPEYPYTSGTTKLLRDNFAELYSEASAMLELKPQDLVIDIGSKSFTRAPFRPMADRSASMRAGRARGPSTAVSRKCLPRSRAGRRCSRG